MRLSIVIPVHNEALALEGFLQKIARVKDQILVETDLDGAEVILVDDGSTDQSLRVMRTFPSFTVVTHERQRGYGQALKTGFTHATGELIAFLDADATYPPESLLELYRRYSQGDVEIIVGSRFIDPHQSKFPPGRQFGNRVLSRFVSIATGQAVTDAASGMRLFRADLAKRFLNLPDGLDFSIAMTVRALHQGLRFSEVGIPYGDRIGASKLRFWRDGLRFTWTVLRLMYTETPTRK